MSLHNNSAAILWQHQFTDRDDFEMAGKVLQLFKFIDANAFKRDLELHIKQSVPEQAKAAFYIERELQLVRPNWRYKQSKGYKVKNKFAGQVAVRMYTETASSRGRGFPPQWTASGSAQPAVKSPTSIQQEIGSEGVVANIVSKLCIDEKARFALHPHTALLSKMHVQYLVVVTDFIGSGKRTKEMLDSLWRVASIRSWKSGGYLKIMVLCYASTEDGQIEVERHQTAPIVKKLLACPTIFNSFAPTERSRILDLCKRYPPGASAPLGYKDTGALIAFEHSCPNNVPAMFTTTQRNQYGNWFALFPKRLTSELSRNQPQVSREHLLKESLEKLKLESIAKSQVFLNSPPDKQAVIVFLAAIYRGRRNTTDIISACELPLQELNNAWIESLKQGLISEKGRLTRSGLGLIDNLKSQKIQVTNISKSGKMNYYPSSLREPKVES